MYGAVMGLAGLGLSARAAATVFPGFLRAPAYFTEPWVALGALLLAVLLPLYLLKLFKFPAAVREDFTNPATLGFCGALPVGMTLVAGGIAPYSALTGNLLWEAGCALLLAFQIWALVRWLSGGIELARLNAGWLIILVGGYLPARRSGLRCRALRAGPPFAAVEAGRRGGAGRRDAVCRCCSLENCSQRCIASGVNSACGWLPPMMNISRCSLPGSS